MPLGPTRSKKTADESEQPRFGSRQRPIVHFTHAPDTAKPMLSEEVQIPHPPTFGAPIKYPEEVQAHSIGIRSSSILAPVFEAGTQLEASAVGSNSKKEFHGFTTPVPVFDSTLNVRCLTMPSHHTTQDATTRFLCSRIHFNFQETLLWTRRHRHISIRLLMTFLL